MVQRLLSNRRVKDALHGTWLGHPVHPALAQLALGAFGSAAVLDVIGRDRDASSRLIVFGAAAAVPTVAAGWADYAEAHEEQQRLGIVHAALNGVASVGFLAVLALRSRGADGAAQGRVDHGRDAQRAGRRHRWGPGVPQGAGRQPRRVGAARRTGGVAVARPDRGPARR